MDKAKNNNKKNNSFSSKYLPNFYYYDKREHLLILEFFPEAKNLREHYISSCRFSRILAVKVGECLGELHQITYDYLHSREENDKDPIISDILSLTYCRTKIDCHQRFYLYTSRSPKIFRDISNANIQLIKIVQSQKELCKTLDELHAGWNSHKRYECLIHSDIKSDNFLTVESLNSPDSSSHSSSDMYKKARHLKLIDWELARIGDPAWDTGCVFSDYLALWLFSLPIINRVIA